jgi:hypothetical protein
MDYTGTTVQSSQRSAHDTLSVPRQGKKAALTAAPLSSKDRCSLQTKTENRQGYAVHGFVAYILMAKSLYSLLQ